MPNDSNITKMISMAGLGMMAASLGYNLTPHLEKYDQMKKDEQKISVATIDVSAVSSEEKQFSKKQWMPMFLDKLVKRGEDLEVVNKIKKEYDFVCNPDAVYKYYLDLSYSAKKLNFVSSFDAHKYYVEKASTLSKCVSQKEFINYWEEEVKIIKKGQSHKSAITHNSEPLFNNCITPEPKLWQLASPPNTEMKWDLFEANDNIPPTLGLPTSSTFVETKYKSQINQTKFDVEEVKDCLAVEQNCIKTPHSVNKF